MSEQGIPPRPDNAPPAPNLRRQRRKPTAEETGELLKILSSGFIGLAWLVVCALLLATCYGAYQVIGQ